MTPVTPEQVLEFAQKFPQFRRLVEQLINECSETEASTHPAIRHQSLHQALGTAKAIRTMIELKDMLES